jgi:DNA-binding response OmpR family regulator
MQLLYIAPLIDAWLHKALREAGHELRCYSGPPPTLEAGTSVIILDAGLANRLCLPALPPGPPRLVLLAADMAAERAALVQAGASACLLRPFTVAELLACLERLVPSPGSDFSLLPRQRALLVRGHTVELTPQEFRLLDVLLKAAEPQSAAALCHALWQTDAVLGAEPLKALLHRLRGKLRRETGQALIELERGRGYVVRFGG